MLNQKNIDELMLQIQSGLDAYVYYIAHRVECREGAIDEYQFKSIPDFRVLRLKVENIYNAYYEYLKYLEHPENYSTEHEETFADEFTKYLFYYTVPNKGQVYMNEFNPRIPSVIFGTRRILYKSGIIVKDYSNPSPIKEKYTNALEYGNLTPAQVLTKLQGGYLDWKYKKFENPVTIDGIDYSYLTSDWFILNIPTFPRTELPLINVKQQTAYFMTNEAAQSYLKQLKA